MIVCDSALRGGEDLFGRSVGHSVGRVGTPIEATSGEPSVFWEHLDGPVPEYSCSDHFIIENSAPVC